jgi:hypothetical protein
MSKHDSTDVSIVAATAGIRVVSADGAQLHVDEPVIAWEIHRYADAHGEPASSVYPVTINGTDYEAYGVQYADGTVSGFGTFYDSLAEAQEDFPNSDA